MIGRSARPPLILIPHKASIIAKVGVKDRYAIDAEGNVYARLKPTVTGWKTKRSNYNLRISGVLRRYTVEEIKSLLPKS